MAKKKVEKGGDAVATSEADTNKGPLPEDNVEAGEDVGDGKGQVTVKYRDHVGQIVSRTFSQDVHGDEFKSLAEEFKTTNAARIVA